jgi:hypothetical protein
MLLAKHQPVAEHIQHMYIGIGGSAGIPPASSTELEAQLRFAGRFIVMSATTRSIAICSVHQHSTIGFKHSDNFSLLWPAPGFCMLRERCTSTTRHQDHFNVAKNACILM